MKKTSLYIDPDTDRALAHLATVEGTTKAELIRRALDAAVAAEPPRPRAIGVFDGPRDLGANADRHLAEGGFGER